MTLTTTPIDARFDRQRRVLPGIAIVLGLHALLAIALVTGNRVLRPETPQAVTLLATVAPEIVEPPPPPQTMQLPTLVPERAAPPLRDIEVAPRTDVVATIADDAPPVEAASGKPEGSGTAGTGDAGTQAGGGKAPVEVRALINPDNCVRPRLPESAEREGVSGVVILALLIGVDGKIEDVRIARSSGEPVIDETARKAARLCHFVAATIDNVAVPSWEAFRFSWDSPPKDRRLFR